MKIPGKAFAIAQKSLAHRFYIIETFSDSTCFGIHVFTMAFHNSKVTYRQKSCIKYTVKTQNFRPMIKQVTVDLF